MSDYFEDLMRQAVDAAVRARHEALEYMCEVMLTTPNSPGIMIDSHYVWLDPRVPFGEIWDVSLCPGLARPDDVGYSGT